MFETPFPHPTFGGLSPRCNSENIHFPSLHLGTFLLGKYIPCFFGAFVPRDAKMYPWVYIHYEIIANLYPGYTFTMIFVANLYPWI